MQANTIIKPKANIIRPVRPNRSNISNIPIRPNQSQQSITQCDFCGQETESLSSVVSIGKQFKVCDSCRKKFQNHRCIMCNTSTEEPMTHQIIEWKGLCERCTQIVMSGATKLKIEQELGVDYDSTMEVIPERDKEISNEELQNWFSYGQNFLSSTKRK